MRRQWLTVLLAAIAALLTAHLPARTHVTVTGLAQITIADARIPVPTLVGQAVR